MNWGCLFKAEKSELEGTILYDCGSSELWSRMSKVRRIGFLNLLQKVRQTKHPPNQPNKVIYYGLVQQLHFSTFYSNSSKITLFRTVLPNLQTGL